MREKLIELMKKLKIEFHRTCLCYTDTVEHCDDCKYYHDDLCDYSARCADFLLQNNVVVLPCKVGDTVWIVCDGYVTSALVLALTYNGFGIVIKCIKEGGVAVREVIIDTDEFVDKNFFLTKEEAEKELERSKAK